MGALVASVGDTKSAGSGTQGKIEQIKAAISNNTIEPALTALSDG